VSSIPSNAQVTAAKLEIYRFGAIFGDNNNWDMDATIQVRKITESWSSSTATWDNLSDSYDQTVIDFDEYTTGVKDWFEFDVTETIGGFVSNPETNFGFMVFSDNEVPTTSSGSLSKFHNAEAATSSLRPKLTITYDASNIVHKVKDISLFDLSVYNSARFVFTTPTEMSADVTVYSSDGSVLKKIRNKRFTAGENSVCFRGDLASGIYFVKILGKDIVLLERLVLTR
jgi:hypothetical protein